MRGLKIKDKWLKLILSGQKTMDVRSQYLKIRGQRIALGNSDTGMVEGYATVEDVIKILYSQIGNYENQHRATTWLTKKYGKKAYVFGYILKDVKTEHNPFQYPKSRSISFKIKAEGTP
jgi:hypothetical protein